MAKPGKAGKSDKRRSVTRPIGSWHTHEGECHDEIAATVNKLLGEKRRSELATWRDLFMDRQPAGIAGARAGYERFGMRSRMNIVRNACETLIARCGKNQPRPWLVTVGGDWKLQRKAKKTGQFVEGDWERLNADRLRRDALRDATIYGTGIIKVWPDYEREQVCWARVWAGDLLTHKREEIAGSIRTMYQVAFVDREVAKGTWPDKASAIEDADPANATHLRYTSDGEDLITLYEAWRLPSSVDAEGKPEGGRHCVVIDGATLEDEPWARDTFPFARLPYSDDPETIWGVGLPERMAGAQSEQNALSELASDIARMMTPKYVMENGSQMTTATMSNEIEVWEFTGTAPVVISAESNILAMMQAAAIQRQAAYAIEGISESSAEGTTPENLDSGKAQLVNRDIQSERHVELGKRVEEFTVELCKLHVACCEDLVADGAKLVAYAGKSMLEALEYGDVRLADDPYHVRVYPVSALSNSPQGKLAQLNEMLAAGTITVAEWRELYDMPDMDRSNDLAFAGRELARKLVEQALDGNIVAATRACDLPHLVDHGWKSHALAQLEGASDDDLEHLRNLLGSAQALLDQQAAAEMAKQAAMAPPPMPMPPAAAPLPVPPTGPIGIVQ